MHVDASHHAVSWIHSISFAGGAAQNASLLLVTLACCLRSPHRGARCTFIATSPRSQAKHDYRLSCSSANRTLAQHHSILFSSLSVGDTPIQNTIANTARKSARATLPHVRIRKDVFRSKNAH